MGWFTPKTSDNELGEYLPDEDAQLCEESELIQALSKPEADRKCQEVADAYGGIEPKVTHTGQPAEYDCNFKVWR